MFVMKLDGTGGTDVVLHYIPANQIEGLLVLWDQDAGCHCLDISIKSIMADDEGVTIDSYSLTAYSSTDLQDVIAFADALAKRIWGEVIDVGEIRSQTRSVVPNE